MRTMRRLILTALTILAATPAYGLYLKQATAATVKLKPVYVLATGLRKTTGITLHAAHVLVSKNGASSSGMHSTAAPTLESVTGQRIVTLDTTDTDTLGRLVVDWPDDVNGVTVPEFFDVIDPNEFNRMFVTGEINVYSLGGSKAAVTNAVTVYSTDFAADYNSTSDMWNTDVRYVRGSDPIVSPGEPNLIAAFQGVLYGAWNAGLAQNGPWKRVWDFLSGDAYVRQGAPVGASVSADLAALSAKVGTPAADVSTDIAAMGTDIAYTAWLVPWIGDPNFTRNTMGGLLKSKR